MIKRPWVQLMNIINYLGRSRKTEMVLSRQRHCQFKLTGTEKVGWN